MFPTSKYFLDNNIWKFENMKNVTNIACPLDKEELLQHVCRYFFAIGIQYIALILGEVGGE